MQEEQASEMTPPKERHLADREWVGVADPFLKKYHSHLLASLF
jgi:hypothetical protein